MFGKDLINKVSGHAQRIASAAAFELVHVETAGIGRQFTIRIFIDKPGGITLDDCSEFSRRLSAALDTEDLVSSQYLLEVSSPGLERGLYKLADFEKFSGHAAKVKTSVAIDGQKKFRGTITGVEQDKILFADKTRGDVKFAFEDVKSANLEVDFSQELKRRKG